MKYSPVTNFINGEQVSGDGQILEVFSPVNGEVISEVPLSSAVVVDKAVDAAREAFPDWSTLTLKERVQIFFRYRQLLEKYRNELTALVSEENGKTSAEAAAEVDKSIELTEFATSLPQLCVGEIEVVSRGVECRSERHPLGVVASISPFNFPNMVPNWTIPNALALGNTMILKPSEQVPLSANRITEILVEAGLPKGVLNVVHLLHWIYKYQYANLFLVFQL